MLRDEKTKVAFFVMTLPSFGAIFCQVLPKQCTETFQEGHARLRVLWRDSHADQLQQQ